MGHPVQENVDLAGFTTLRIGGPARFFSEVSTEGALFEGLEFAESRDVPLLILGGGSNLLVADSGFPGLALRVRIGGTRITDAHDPPLIHVGAGVEWDAFVAECVEDGLYGLECLSGIPGWVGATPIQNVGAYGQEVSDAISSVRAYDRVERGVVQLSAPDCRFAYRTSRFNTVDRGRYVVLGVEYRLQRRGEAALDYPDLKRRFRGRTDTPGLEEVRDAVLAIRRSKAMLVEAGDADCQSAGSFFKNPVLSRAQWREVEIAATNCGHAGDQIPRFALESGEVKVPAAWLIERSGFEKGQPVGPVGLSEKHALALVNRGGGTAKDILDLAGEIQSRVEDIFGVRLSAEPAFVGFPDPVVERFSAAAG